MSQKVIFKHACPNCTAKSKVVKKCKDCLRYCCSECSISILCVDCYVRVDRNKIIHEYNKDKYKRNVPEGIFI